MPPLPLRETGTEPALLLTLLPWRTLAELLCLDGALPLGSCGAKGPDGVDDDKLASKLTN
jgi:hypothetical protein